MRARRTKERGGGPREPRTPRGAGDPAGGRGTGRGETNQKGREPERPPSPRRGADGRAAPEAVRWGQTHGRGDNAGARKNEQPLQRSRATATHRNTEPNLDQDCAEDGGAPKRTARRTRGQRKRAPCASVAHALAALSA